MKKFLKRVVLPLIVVFAVLVGLCFVPAIQRTVVHKILSGYVEDLEIGRLAAGLGSFQIENLRFKKDGAIVSLASADVDFSLSKIVFDRQVVIGRLAVKGLAADLSAFQMAESSVPEMEPAKALATEVSSPAQPFDWTLAVDMIAADAKVILPAQKGTLSVSLSGQNIGTARTGTCALDVSFSGLAEGQMGVYSQLKAQSGITIESGLLPSRAELKADMQAQAGTLSGSLSMEASVNRSPENGYEYALSLTQMQLPLVSVKGKFDSTKQLLDAAFSVAIKDTQIAPFAMGINLPAIDLDASGNLSADIAKMEGTVAAQLQARVWNLEKLDPRLSALGTLRLSAEGDVSYENGILSAKKLAASLFDGKSAQWLSVNGAQTFQLDLNKLDSPNAFTNFSGDLLNVDITGIPVALAQPFVPQMEFLSGSLSGQIVVSAQEGALKVSTLKPISLLKLNIAKDGAALANVDALQANLNAVYKDRTVAFGYGVGLSLPVEKTSQSALSAQGSGQYALNTSALSAEGNATLTIAALLGQPSVQGKLPPSVRIPYAAKTAYKIAADTKTATISALDFHVEDSGTALLTAKLLKPIAVNFESPANPVAEDGVLAQIKVDSFDLSAINPFMPEGLTLRSGQLSSAFDLSKKGKSWLLGAQQPLRVQSLNLDKDGSACIAHLSVAMTPEITYSVEQTQVNIQQISLNCPPSTVSALSGAADIVLAGVQPKRMEVSLSSNLPALLDALPILSPVDNVGRGSVSVNVDLSQDGAFHLSTIVAGLSPKFGENAGNAVSGFSATLSGKYAMQPMSVYLSGPFALLGNSGTSQANLNLAWSKDSDGGQSFAAGWDGDTIHAADFMAMASAFAPPSQNPYVEPSPATQASAKTSAVTDNQPDAQPFWHGFTGSVRVKLKALTYDKFKLMSPALSADITPDMLNLSTLSAALEGASLTASGKLMFSRAIAKPYQLNAAAGLSNLDVGKLLVAGEKDKTPFLEGTFSTEGALAGQGMNLSDLVARLQGNFSAYSSNGVLHVLSGSDNQFAQLMGAGASIVSAFLSGNKTDVPVLTPLLDVLNALHYQQLSVKIIRGADLNIVLNEFLVQGNDAMIVGNGRIVHQEGVELMSQPLEMQAQLFAKEGIASPLSALGLFERTPLESGYYPGPVFPIRGTLSDINASPLSDLISQSVQRLGTRKVESSTQQQPSRNASGRQSPSSERREQGGRLIQNVLKGLLN